MRKPDKIIESWNNSGLIDNVNYYQFKRNLSYSLEKTKNFLSQEIEIIKEDGYFGQSPPP